MNTSTDSVVSKSRFKLKLTPEIGALFALLAICLVLSLTNKYFLTVSNFTNLLKQVVVVGIAGVGVTFVIISGGIDLSVGSAVSFSAVLVAGFIQYNKISSYVAVPIVLLIGCSLGFLNGSMVTFLRIPPIIATLSTLIAFKGAALVYTGGYMIPLIMKFMVLGRGSVGPVPVPTLILLAVYCVAFVVLKYTMLGRIAYGLGGNQEAIRLSGISVRKSRLIIYTISGFTAALAGIIIASRLSSGEPTVGDGVELDAIAAAVLGGTSIFGGAGTVWGTLIGAFILIVIKNGLNLMNVSPYSQFIARGAILAFAVTINSMKSFNK
ncbi:MAG: ABC transporter permease [Planctomycetota bacterium]|jgi:ribose transport system permease protein